MAKLKLYRLTSYYRGCELDYIVCTTSMKRVSELFDKGLSYLKSYCSIHDEPNVQECIDNPEVVYVQVGIGGEVLYFMERKETMLLSKAKEIIDNHRKICQSYNETIEWHKAKTK